MRDHLDHLEDTRGGIFRPDFDSPGTDNCLVRITDIICVRVIDRIDCAVIVPVPVLAEIIRSGSKTRLGRLESLLCAHTAVDHLGLPDDGTIDREDGDRDKDEEDDRHRDRCSTSLWANHPGFRGVRLLFHSQCSLILSLRTRTSCSMLALTLGSLTSSPARTIFNWRVSTVMSSVSGASA